MIDKPKVIGEDTRYRFACDASHGFWPCACGEASLNQIMPIAPETSGITLSQ
ncbi:hypothetical protein BN132_1831 [Cronobacter turicensis 564]|nr:hypothetical protein BN132_1831 [Cronobacter turicensis 564]